MPYAQRHCPQCRLYLVKPAPADFFHCPRCRWTDDPHERKLLYQAGAKETPR